MKDPTQHHPIDTLGEAYEKMLAHTLENFHSAEEKTGRLLHQLIDEAKERSIQLGELPQKEAEKLAVYLQRDLRDAANYLSGSEHELKDWLGFETTVLESEILDLLLKAADDTTVNLIQLKESAHRASTYRTGEVTGPGTLVCEQCGEVLHFRRAGKIPPCPKCHATTYRRHTG